MSHAPSTLRVDQSRKLKVAIRESVWAQLQRGGRAGI